MPDNLLSPSMGLLNTDLQKANADPGNVKAGLTFYAGDKTLKTGTLQDLGSEPLAAGGTLYNNGVYFYIGENGGQGRYIVQRGVYWDYGSVANLIGLTADKIRSGQQILGITGTFTGDNNNIRIELAGRVWANGVANASGHANSAYAYGSHDAYSARLYASYSGNYGVYFKDGWSFRWYNAGDQLMYTGPNSGYGSGEAYYAHH